MALAKASKKLVIVLIVAAFALASLTFAAITVSQNVSSSGTIATSPTVGVYSDSACTNKITSINWGSAAAGDTATQTVYVKNTGNGAMALSLAVSSWSPSAASTYMTISWSQQGTQLSASHSVAATITLTVSSSITGITSFSNTITISGTG